MDLLDGGILRETKMKVLIIGPSPHMKHDPGLTVCEFISNYSDNLSLIGCFYDHDFTRMPLEASSNFYFEDRKDIQAHWISNEDPNGPVIAVYECICSNKIDCIVSFGSPVEVEFIRAAIETSAFNGKWIHYLTIANHLHDNKLSDSINCPDFIFSYSKSQILNINKICGVSLDKFVLIERKFEFPDSKKEKGIVFGGWNTEAYNLKSIFEVISQFECSKKCLTNYYEIGDFDLDAIKKQYFYSIEKDSIFVDDFANLFYKPSYENWDKYIDSYSIYVDMSMQQGSCRTLERAYNSGSTCFVIDTPRHREFAPPSERYILINSSVFFSSSGYRLYVPNHLDMYVKLSKFLDTLNNNLIYKSSKIIKDLSNKKDLENLFNKIILDSSERRYLDLESIT